MSTASPRPQQDPLRGRPRTNRAWTGKHEYSHLSSELALADEDTFGRLALALLHLVWTPVGEPLGTTSWTRAQEGVLLASDRSPHPLFVQPMVFREPPESLGEPQVVRVREAVERFRVGGVAAETFLLVYNADARKGVFRAGVETALQSLAGQVARAEAWDRQRLLREAFNAMADHVRAAVYAGGMSIAPIAEALRQSEGEPLAEVPLRVSMLAADQHRLRSSEELVPPGVTDPAAAVLADDKSNLSLLLGGFGFGKTTAIARALVSGSTEVLCVPGGAISDEIRGAKDLLVRCVDLERLLGGCSPADRAVCDRIVRTAVEYLFKDPDVSLTLILDGLDESPFLCRQGGLQHLFNNLSAVRIPVVLTMRTEFWQSRQEELGATIGKVGDQSGTRVRKIRAVELLPWGDAEISRFVHRAREASDDPEAQARLGELEALAAGGRFDALFGDIPRRPLFLRFVTELVAEEGLPTVRVGRARLVYDWARRKIRRDILDPQRSGGGRRALGAGGDSLEASSQIAWEVMVWAAAAMTGEHEGALELLPDCPLDRILGAPHLPRIGDELTLYLQSLLLPVGERTSGRPSRVTFAHRAFQEFFLAWFLVREGTGGEWEIPGPVLDWMSDLRQEGLVSPRTSGSAPPWTPLRTEGRTPERKSMGEPDRPQAPDLELLVEERAGSGGRTFDLRLKARDPELGLNYEPVGELSFKSDPGEFFRRQMGDFDRRLSKTPAERRAFRLELEAKGAFLSETILPPVLRWHLSSLQGRVRTLQVQSDEPWVPWELLRIGRDAASNAADGPFLCEAFALTRWIRSMPQTAHLPLARIAAIVVAEQGPEAELEHVEDEYADLLALGREGVRRVERIPARLEDVLAAFRRGEHDGWHFSGHGSFKESSADLAAIGLDDDDLTPSHLSGESKRMGVKRPLVFLNACSTGRSALGLTGVAGWAPSFLRAGARAFLGALWEVDDSAARTFARAFYAAFLEGSAIAEAVRAARKVLRDGGHPAWLAYTVFAHPLAVCAPRPFQPSAEAAAPPAGPSNAPRSGPGGCGSLAAAARSREKPSSAKG